MLAIIWASLKKEVREVLRDKRTLLLTILVPLGFYPAMSLMTKDLERKQSAKMEDRVVQVAVAGWGDDDLTDNPKLMETLVKIKWFSAELSEKDELLRSGDIDIFLEVESEPKKGYVHKKVIVHYFSTIQGSLAMQRVSLLLDKMRELEVVKQLGGNENMLKPIEIVGREDHATAREVSGNKYGGMGAYFITFLAFTGCMAVAVDTGAGEKERGTLEAMLVTPGSFMGVAAGKLVFIFIMGMISVLSTIGGIVIMVVGYGGGSGFSVADVGITSLLGIAILLISLLIFFSAILFAFSILAKSSKEAHVRSSLLMIVVAMSLVYCIIPGVGITKTILWVPILNAAMSIKELWGGKMPLIDYLQVLVILITLSAIVLCWISRKVNKDREKILLKQ